MDQETGVSDARVEEKLGKQKDEAIKDISTLKPIEDFKEMINYKYDDLTEKALNQMKKIIIKLVNESFKGSFYFKALECLKVLREECDKNDEVEMFNNFMMELIEVFPKERYIDFWRIIISHKITLISVHENKKSSVSTEDANGWLDRLDKKPVINSTIKDLNDLIADMD